MAMRALYFISSILITITVFSQEVDSLTVEEPILTDTTSILVDSLTEEEIPEKIKRKFFSVLPSIDIGKLLTIPIDFETKYEGGLELRFSERFCLYAEAGSVTTSPKQAYTNGIYESTGTYYRLGAGYVGKLDPEHHIGLSFRYGSSSFDEDGRIFITSPSESQSDFTQTIARTGLSAQWWGVVIYSDKKLLENSDLLWLGLNIHLRVLGSYDSQESPDVYAIPGYGRAFDKTIPAANFFLKVKF